MRTIYEILSPRRTTSSTTNRLILRYNDEQVRLCRQRQEFRTLAQQTITDLLEDMSPVDADARWQAVKTMESTLDSEIATAEEVCELVRGRIEDEDHDHH